MCVCKLLFLWNSTIRQNETNWMQSPWLLFNSIPLRSVFLQEKIYNDRMILVSKKMCTLYVYARYCNTETTHSGVCCKYNSYTWTVKIDGHKGKRAKAGGMETNVLARILWISLQAPLKEPLRPFYFFLSSLSIRTLRTLYRGRGPYQRIFKSLVDSLKGSFS